MPLIQFDKNDFDSFLERTEATFKAEFEIQKDMLERGIDGLEWLIINTVVDDDSKKNLDDWIRLAPMLAKDTTNPIEILIDSVKVHEDKFYDKHGINWWITFDEALTYFALLKERDYNSYFKLLSKIYQ